MPASITTEDASRLLLAIVMFSTGGWAAFTAMRAIRQFAWHLTFVAFWSFLAGLGMAALIAPDNWLPSWLVEVLNVSYVSVIVGWAALVARLERRVIR